MNDYTFVLEIVQTLGVSWALVFLLLFYHQRSLARIEKALQEIPLAIKELQRGVDTHLYEIQKDILRARETRRENKNEVA